MNIKRILSSVLVVIMLFSAVSVLVPVKAQAAHYSDVSTTKLDNEKVAEIVSAYQKAAYTSAEEMFQADLAAGYLDHSTNGEFAIYVNRYTGVMYYRNISTGKMLTSNSYNFTGIGAAKEYTSQISVVYSTVSDTENTKPTMYSSEWAAARNQITVSKIDGGLRVSYAIGDTSTRCLLPHWIEVSDFEDAFLRPMFEQLYTFVAENLGETYAIDFFDESATYYKNGSWSEETIANEKFLHTMLIRAYDTAFKSKLELYEKNMKAKGMYDNEKKALVEEATAIMEDIKVLVFSYTPYNTNHKSSYDPTVVPEAVFTGTSMYKIITETYSSMAVRAEIVKKYCPNYTFDQMYEHEERCNFEYIYEPKPVFRCSLEYTFNEDGSLSVRLPSNSIVFDETEYILKTITPLQYFGAADFSNNGYIFLPDGSGSIIEFDDFRNSNVTLTSALSFYGNDYCYSQISGAHKQPLTMPVYGIATTKDANGNPVGHGYFAILEEGSSMASINVNYISKSFREGSIFTTFAPYPNDKFDLSDTISVSNNSSYTIVSESKYSGSYVTRYVMLEGNDTYADANTGKIHYAATYMGMAEYYRDYLVKNGTLTALENTGNDLPLYLEALGSIEIVEKILTFPVNVSRPITTFEDVATIYAELGDAKDKLLAKAEEYNKLAEAEEDDPSLKASYSQTAKDYERLAAEVYDIDNINFKLTGFANGGLASTYPSKLKWERSVGGNRGFKKLLKLADEKTTNDSTFGVYPDFDFQYINNTAPFDKVGKRNTVSRMVDNRYASKQVYSSVSGEYDTVYAMIVSADSLDRLYDKFIRKYDNYKLAKGISVSTLGSDLNSNFDKKNPISRDDAQGYVTDLLARISNESNYSVMISQGNIYAVKYADHILGVCTDSSYYRYSSYTIPFIGMVLHGYVNYTGSALNYSGSPDYDILRSIENGAALYYIIGYQNTDLMKDDEELNKYYSVSYENWFDDIVKNYATVNRELGDIQEYRIVDHKVIIGERVIDKSEQVANLEALKAEFVNEFRLALKKAISDKQKEIPEGEYTKRISVNADIAALVAVAHEMFELDVDETLPESFADSLKAVLADIQREYNTDGVAAEDIVAVEFNAAEFTYESAYQYVTGSTALDDNYEKTDYTSDNDLIVMVTYANKDGSKTRTFILNYNIYAVEVVLEEGAEPIVIDKYSFWSDRV